MRFSIICQPAEQRTIALSGRNLWALECLIKAGSRGITSLTNPAPRLAAYMHCLRELGVEIETVHEPHDGPYPGYHARYFLRSQVERVGA